MYNACQMPDTRTCTSAGTHWGCWEISLFSRPWRAEGTLPGRLSCTHVQSCMRGRAGIVHLMHTCIYKVYMFNHTYLRGYGDSSFLQ